MGSRLIEEVRYARAYFRNRAHYERQHGRKIPWDHTCRWYAAWRRSLGSGRSPVMDRVPWIVYGAEAYISGFLKPTSRVFEYGMGGSTLFFLDAGCTVISVEHDAAWGHKLSDLIQYNGRWTNFVVPPRAYSPHATAANTYSSMFPGYESSDFRNYVEVILSEPDESLDVVMIDGRARSAACALAAAKVIPGGRIVLDNAERPRYDKAVKDLVARGWSPTRFSGAGPYVANECWDTLILQKPS